MAHVITIKLLIDSWTPATSSTDSSRNPSASAYQVPDHGSPPARFVRAQNHSSAEAVSSRHPENQEGRLFSWSTSKS